MDIGEIITSIVVRAVTNEFIDDENNDIFIVQHCKSF